MRVAVVTPIPTPYRDPFWNVFARCPGIDLSVYYCAAGKDDRPWAGDWERVFHNEVLPGRNLVASLANDASIYDNPSIVKRLEKYEFEVVLIGGYNHLTMWRAMRWCRRREVPYFLMCESHLDSPRSGLRRWLKDGLVRRAVGGMAGGLPTGKLAERYLIHYGASPKLLMRLPNVPDVEAIREQVTKLRAGRSALRAQLGLEDRPTVLFVGRLIPKKGADIVLRALATMNKSSRPQLAIVGDGVERSRLEKLADELKLDDTTRWAGFVEPTDIVCWYAASDVFVLPSRETWGVVVLEALASGLAVILSDEVGCHPDLARVSEQVRVVARGELGAWKRAIETAASPSFRDVKSEAKRLDRFRYEPLAEQLAAHLRGEGGQSLSDPPRAVTA